MIPLITKALIIRFSSIGDILLSSLLVRAFRTRFPECRLDYAVKDEYADLVRHNPNLSNVIVLPSGGSFGDLRHMRKEIRETGYDLIIDIHDSLRSRFLASGHGQTFRINKRKVARLVLIKTGINLYPKLGGSPGVAMRYLETVGFLGVKDDGAGLEIHVPDEVRVRIESRIGRIEKPLIGVAPGALHRNKMWLPDGFARTALALALEHRTGIILFGAAGDQEQCDAVAAILALENPEIPVHNMAGRTTLLEAAALLDHCSVVLTNDSGLMHLAAARKRRVVAVFGPTVREFGFFPFGTSSTVVEHLSLSCRPCTHIGLDTCPKGHFRCMIEISHDRVLTAARDLLET